MTAWGPQVQPSGYRGGRVFRAAALAIGNGWTHLAFDSISDQLTAFGVSIDGNGDIVPGFTGVAMLAVDVATDAAAQVSGLQIRIAREPSGSNKVVGNGASSSGAGNVQRIHIDAWFDVLEGQPIRVLVAADGVGSANLVLDQSQVNATLIIYPHSST